MTKKGPDDGDRFDSVSHVSGLRKLYNTTSQGTWFAPVQLDETVLVERRRSSHGAIGPAERHVGELSSAVRKLRSEIHDKDERDGSTCIDAWDRQTCGPGTAQNSSMARWIDTICQGTCYSKPWCGSGLWSTMPVNPEKEGTNNKVIARHAHFQSRFEQEVRVGKKKAATDEDMVAVTNAEGDKQIQRNDLQKTYLTNIRVDDVREH